MDSFKEYQDMIQDIDKRKAAAIENAGNIKREIDILQTDYNAAEVYSGEDPKTIKYKIDKLQDDHAEALRVLLAFEAAPKPGTHMVKIADEVIAESRVGIGALQAEYSERAAVLPGMKAAYLAVVKELGEINRAGQELAREANIARKASSNPKLYIYSIITDIGAVHRTGSIFIDNAVVEAAYKDLK